ncbi:MAG: RNA polymerase sigma factor [Woeseiaceae bacterium]|nr:RNA polymerase sigma factor [Woeseiaceae bacterium]
MQKVVELGSRRRESGRFEALLEPHFAVLYNAARRLAASPADAEDLVQDVCIKAYRYRADLRVMEYPRAWLLRTLYNQFVDDQRRLQRSPQGRARTMDGDDGFELAAPERSQPDEETERMLNIEAIERAMSRLSREQRSLLAMHDIDGLSLAEIQAVTDLPLGTIKSKLHRARVRLGRMLVRLDSVAAAMTRTGG